MKDITVDQRMVDRIIARAQNSSMGLGDPKNKRAYDISVYEPQGLEELAILLVSAHHQKYDIISVVYSALLEVLEVSENGNPKNHP